MILQFIVQNYKKRDVKLTFKGKLFYKEQLNDS